MDLLEAKLKIRERLNRSDIHITPLNKTENHFVPVGIHNLNVSKSFLPSLASVRILSMGTNLITKWRKENYKGTFKHFNIFPKE